MPGPHATALEAMRWLLYLATLNYAKDGWPGIYQNRIAQCRCEPTERQPPMRALMPKPTWDFGSLSPSLLPQRLNWRLPQSNVWGHLFAIAGMFLGTLVMIKSQEGYVPPEMPDDNDDGPSVQPMA
jgi:hypothetical protein